MFTDKVFTNKEIENFINNFQIKTKKEQIYFYKNVDWVIISKYFILPEDFIREFQDYIIWPYISNFQLLSENFMREFQNEIDWYWVSVSQILSENFMREFQDKIHWILIIDKQHMSSNFIKEFKYKFPYYVENIGKNWLEMNEEEKIKELSNICNILEDDNGKYIESYECKILHSKYKVGTKYKCELKFCRNYSTISYNGYETYTKIYAIEIFGKSEEIPYNLIKMKIYIKDIFNFVNDKIIISLKKEIMEITKKC